MTEFDYKIVSKNTVTVITLSGKLSKDSLNQLENCRKDLAQDAASVMIIYFKDVPTVDPCVFRELTILQQEIRKKNAHLYVTGLDNSNRQYLLDKAIIRNSEIRKSLMEVFEDLKKTT